MAKTFKNLSQLNNHVNKILKKAMDKVGEEVAKELKRYVDKNWYEANGVSTYYHRTMQFVESITFQTMVSQGRVFVEVYFDPDLIDAMEDKTASWNQHMSVHKEDVTEGLVGWIEYGQNSPLHSYSGIHMVKHTRDWAKKEYRSLLIKQMARFGIKLE